MNRFKVVIFLNLCIVLVESSVFFNTVKITKLTAEFNPEWIENGTCTLKPINRKKQLINCEAFLRKPMNNFWVTLDYFKFYSGYKRTYSVIKLNLCDFFRKARMDFIMKSSMEVVLKYTNLNHSCPISGHVVFKDATIDTSLWHLVVSEGRYKGDVTVTDGVSETPVGHFQFFLEVDELKQ